LLYLEKIGFQVNGKIRLIKRAFKKIYIKRNFKRRIKSKVKVFELSMNRLENIRALLGENSSLNYEFNS